MKILRINKVFCFIIVLLSGSVFCFQAIAKDTRQDEELSLDNPFGVLEFLHWNHSWNNYKYATKRDLEKAAALMKKAGIGWVRMDFLWQDIEAQRGEFNFIKYDNIVGLLSKNNIHILGILDYTADWASACGKWNCPPVENKLFVNFALKVIGRYKDKVKYWEVWNEPDSPTYWQPQDGLKSYCRLLKEVYLEAKKIDPNCKILNGGIAGGLASINHLYDSGAKGYFDILNIHFFESPLNPDAINAVKAYPRLAYKIMSRNGDGNKKIWLTEIGCPGVKKGLKVDNWWMKDNPDELKQAEWLKLIFTQLLEDKSVEKIFWAFLRDCKGHWGNGIDYFGLLRWDFSQKPSFKAYKECFHNWNKSEFTLM